MILRKQRYRLPGHRSGFVGQPCPEDWLTIIILYNEYKCSQAGFAMLDLPRLHPVSGQRSHRENKEQSLPHCAKPGL